jgi:integrase/recombinase XerC
MSKRNLQTLSETDSAALFVDLAAGGFTEQEQRRAARNTCIAILMLDAGLRVGEVLRLYIGDLLIADVPVETLTVRAQISKSKTERWIPLTGRAKLAIARCNEKIWKLDPHGLDSFAFKGRGRSGRITSQQVERIIKKAGLQSLHRDIHPHLLRHTFATRLMRKTNARVVQQLLGHRNMSSTQIYCHPGPDDLKEAIAAIEPTRA